MDKIIKIIFQDNGKLSAKKAEIRESRKAPLIEEKKQPQVEKRRLDLNDIL